MPRRKHPIGAAEMNPARANPRKAGVFFGLERDARGAQTRKVVINYRFGYEIRLC